MEKEYGKLTLSQLKGLLKLEKGFGDLSAQLDQLLASKSECKRGQFDYSKAACIDAGCVRKNQP